MVKIVSKKDKEFKIFIEKLNIAYKEREKYGINFIPLCEDDAQGAELIFAMYDGGEIVAGACVNKNVEGQVRLSHVWSDVTKKRKGHAYTLLSKILDKLKTDGEEFIYLLVIGTYSPALNLYKKLGFKKISYFANEIGQPYGIKMVKKLSGKFNIAFNLRCVFKKIFEKIKFSLLFTKNSRPKLLGKFLYEKRGKQ